jgi:cytochrome c oxidase subunit IV
MATRREEITPHQDDHTPHIMPVATYLAVFAGLLVLLAVTVGVSFLDLGVFSKILAVTIAATKAILIFTYFMHLRYSPRLVWVFAGIGFLWFILLFAITMGDYMARGGIAPLP